MIKDNWLAPAKLKLIICSNSIPKDKKVNLVRDQIERYKEFANTLEKVEELLTKEEKND